MPVDSDKYPIKGYVLDGNKVKLRYNDGTLSAGLWFWTDNEAKEYAEKYSEKLSMPLEVIK